MLVRFNKGATWTTFSVVDTDYDGVHSTVSTIRNLTSARPEGYAYMPSFKTGRWDGFIHLCECNKFPTGLLPLVSGHLSAQGCNVAVEDKLPELDIDGAALAPDMFEGITLRPYQVKAAKLCLSYGRGVLKMATNSGKTVVIAALARVIRGGVMVLTTKRDLLHQTAERLSNRLQEPVGLIGDGYWEPERVTVATIQTLRSRLSQVKWKLDSVIFDECHHLPSKSSRTVMLGLDAPLRFGFSGTPLRNENLNDLILIGATGPVLLEVTNADLIAAGISAVPTVDMYTVESDDNYMAKWHVAYDACIVENAVRNGLIAKEVLHRVRRMGVSSTLVLVERIKHGHMLQQMMVEKGMAAMYVTGSSPMDERKQALEQLRAGGGTVVIATAPIFGEGIDAPAVDLLVLAGGGKGHIRLLQNLGRGMRRKEGANVLQVIDFLDDTNEHLLKHSWVRTTLYEREGFQVNIVE